MKNKTRKFDVSKYLDSPEAIKEYLEKILEQNGIEGFQRALGHVAKAPGMTEIAKKANVGRESLYKSLSETGKPRLDTIHSVLQALGLQLSIKTSC
jgi:probable addiction module antidote protein